MPATARDLEPWRQLIRADYAQLPGMHLTLAQAQRLWSIDRVTCRAVLDSLVASHFLVIDEEGQYCRADALVGCPLG